MLKKLLVFTCLTLSISVSADIYRCKDPVTGELSFTDTVCKDKTMGTNIPIGLTSATAMEDSEKSKKVGVAQDNKNVRDRSKHNDIASVESK
ncbi:MAG: DUF4124 domain-containing protein [Halioglobus sp.]